MKTMDCNTCRNLLPELLQEGPADSPDLSAHLAACEGCRHDWSDLRATWALMDEWTAPEPSPYFDSRLHARLREAQAAPPEGLWERMSSFVRFSTGRQLRPALAGGLALAMLLGGGTAATVFTHLHSGPSASPTVNDLRIYDNNAQALQQMDLLDDGPDPAPQS